MMEKLEQIREITADVLEVDAKDLTDTGDFREQYEADSIRAIEILSRLEKKYKVEIPQSELPNMLNLRAVYSVVTRYAGWHE